MDWCATQSRRSKLPAFQQQLLTTIEGCFADFNYPPSLADLAFWTGRGKTTIRYHINRLEELGFVRRDKGIARSIRLTTEGQDDA